MLQDAGDAVSYSMEAFFKVKLSLAKH